MLLRAWVERSLDRRGLGLERVGLGCGLGLLLDIFLMDFGHLGLEVWVMVSGLKDAAQVWD